MATRIDASGNVLWRFSAPVKNWAPGKGESKFESVVVLPDDSALFCGWKNIVTDIGPTLFGVLTHIDKSGKVLNERITLPNGDKSFRLNYLNKCVAWGEGVAVVGTARRVTGETIPRHHEDFSWLLALDAQANIKWEKQIPLMSGLGIDVLVTPNQELIGSAIRVSPTGDISPLEAVRKVRQIVITSDVHSSPNEKIMSWRVEARLRSKAEDQQIKGESDISRSNAEYFLPDHSLVEFGGKTERGTGIAAIAWLSSQSTETETFVFKPFWKAWQVDAAIPTGRPGEFVTLRQAVPWTAPPDPEHFGVVLAFINVQ